MVAKGGSTLSWFDSKWQIVMPWLNELRDKGAIQLDWGQVCFISGAELTEMVGGELRNGRGQTCNGKNPPKPF